MQNTLFAFGSFAPGMVHFGKIEAHVRAARSAFVRGAVYRLPSGIPALASEGTLPISGWLMELLHHEKLFSILDRFHGVESEARADRCFRREKIVAYLDDGRMELTDAYCIDADRVPRGSMALADGDWQRSLQDSPALLQRLTQRQREYIQRLGSSTNREIVPIDLALYRDLMHLEIVIDKGRRVALTSLGREIFRFLS